MSEAARPAGTTRRGFRPGPLAVFITGTAFLAGAVHIGAILLVPKLAGANGWVRLKGAAAEGRFAEIAAPGTGPVAIPGFDPLFVNGACRVHLGEAPAEITLVGGERFWSVSLYDRDGTSVFSLNDRTAIGGRLDMLVATAAQNADLRSEPPAGIEQKIVVEAPSEELIAVARLFAPTAAAQAESRRNLAGAGCSPAPLPADSGSSGG